MEHIVFLTGRLAQASLARVLSGIDAAPFTWEVREIGLQVAALMTAEMIQRRVAAPVRAEELDPQGVRPEALDHLGLASAVNNLARDFERRTNVKVERRIDPNLGTLGPNVELVLYRVAQESLTNIARHSGASQVLLDLSRNGHSVVLRVADNGRGFEQPHLEGGGLRGIRENALIVGGALAIKPSATGGIEVRLEVPA